MLGVVRVVHPLPSALNAIVVTALSLAAGGGPLVAGALAMAMFGFQASIGALNDVVDADRDRLTKPRKPVPAGQLPARGALVISVIGGAVGLAVSAAFGVGVLVLGAAGYACGLAYDLAMRRMGLAWLCFALAVPLLLAWTWLAAAGTWPPAWPLLLPLAALAGPALHLANSLVDLEDDRRSGTISLATQLGPERAWPVLVVLVAIVFVLAWGVLLARAPREGGSLAIAGMATVAAAIGVWLSGRADPRAREVGWLLLAAALAMLAVAAAAALG